MKRNLDPSDFEKLKTYVICLFPEKIYKYAVRRQLKKAEASLKRTIWIRMAKFQNY
jgi:hypothetical protein